MGNPALTGLSVLCCMFAEPPLPIFPPALKTGDTIAIVAPSRHVGREKIERAAGRLEAMGFHVHMRENLFRRRGYLAGEDTDRATELMDAFRDPDVQGIFAGTGGFGSTRILDRLDYDLIRRNPKVLIGYSDITALHLAIQKRTGLVTFHGPLLESALGREKPFTDFSADYLWRAVMLKSDPMVASQPAEMGPGYAYAVPDEKQAFRVLSPGVARGRLTGGNLSLICTLMGTPYEIETDNRVLFLEDVHEEPYRIDRYLSQLRLAGKFDSVTAVILGKFTDAAAEEGKPSLTLDEIFQDYFADLGVPVTTNFPAGHVANNATLPINVLIEVDTTVPRVRLLEDPVRRGA